MGQKEKLVARLRSMPRDFTIDETERLLGLLGFERSNKGRTSGSRVKFVGESGVLELHRPHPGNELKPYQVKQLLRSLEGKGLL